MVKLLVVRLLSTLPNNLTLIRRHKFPDGGQGPGGHVELPHVQTRHVPRAGAGHAADELARGIGRGMEDVIAQGL